MNCTFSGVSSAYIALHTTLSYMIGDDLDNCNKADQTLPQGFDINWVLQHG